MLAPVNLICGTEEKVELIYLNYHLTATTYSRQMSSGDRQTNAQWNCVLVIRSSGVANALDNKYQDEGDQGLNYDRLSEGYEWTHCGHTQVSDKCGGSCYLE